MIFGTHDYGRVWYEDGGVVRLEGWLYDSTMTPIVGEDIYFDVYRGSWVFYGSCITTGTGYCYEDVNFVADTLPLGSRNIRVRFDGTNNYVANTTTTYDILHSYTRNPSIDAVNLPWFKWTDAVEAMFVDMGRGDFVV